jgi:hypothetical protein
MKLTIKISWMDKGLMLVIGGGIATILLLLITGNQYSVYVMVFCAAIDIFHRGIWQSIAQKRKMISDGKRFTLEQKLKGQRP